MGFISLLSLCVFTSLHPKSKQPHKGTGKNGAKISVFGSDKKVNVTVSIDILPNASNFSHSVSSLIRVSLLQSKGLSPGNADVPVGLDLPRHLSCRRGRRRSQGNKVAEPSRLRRARCPRSFEGSNRRERGRPARMKEESRR
jgi:hypothetical protein